MTKTILNIEGMQCGMCESHVNDAIRNSFAVKKVTSSHAKNCTEILSEQPLDEQKLREVIGKTGYDFVSVSAKPYEKHGLFGFLKK